MSSPKRNRARILTASGLKKLREQIRSHEVEANAGFKYTLERLGELTGLDPETVKNVLDCKGSDKSSIARCFESFGLMLAESDHIPAAQATTTADPNFVGRDEAIADLSTLVSRNAKVIVIQARGGVGKTTLARKYLQQAFGSFLEFPIAKETKDIASIEGLLEEKLRQLGEEPGREFLVSLDRLKRKLQAERLGILIDNLEPALDSAGKFIEAHRRYVELLRVLSDPTVQSLTLITSRERLREADVTVQHYPLRSLSVQAWLQFFQSRSINVDTPTLATLHDAYGGNAKAMDIISGAVLEDFSGDVEAYWQANQDDLFIERDLEDLVAKQFDRLQQLDPDAYKLLCRMGCYRYQDVPTVPIEGLFCLLWDVPENRHRRVIKSLQDRSLVDFENGEFWLHPVIRAEAIGRLKISKDWKFANCKAAELWTDSIEVVETVEEAIKGLEPYYHYVSIQDFEGAGYSLVKKRFNREGYNVHLGSSFYRLGLPQQMLYAISCVIDKIPPGWVKSRLYNLLGDQCWAVGDINKSIECHQRSGEMVSVTLELITQSKLAYRENEKQEEIVKKLKGLEILAIYNLAFCKLSLWELDSAMRLFKEYEYKTSIGTIDDGICYISSRACLAFLNSHFGDKQNANRLIQEVMSEIPRTSSSSWTLVVSMIFLGLSLKELGRTEKAFEMYQRAIAFAENSYYIQLKAKALIGLGDLYRYENKYKESVQTLSQAIDLLEKLGSKCDLAEAYYQLGLVYQGMNEIEECSSNFQMAIRLFDEIKAPKQIERVRQSMQN